MITATIMNTTMTTITIITTLERRLVAAAAAYIVYSVIPFLRGRGRLPDMRPDPVA